MAGTKRIEYVGFADARGVGKEDFAKAEIDHKNLTFIKGQPVELPSDIADKLLSHAVFAGEFKESKPAADAPPA